MPSDEISAALAELEAALSDARDAHAAGTARAARIKAAAEIVESAAWLLKLSIVERSDAKHAS